MYFGYFQFLIKMINSADSQFSNLGFWHVFPPVPIPTLWEAGERATNIIPMLSLIKTSIFPPKALTQPADVHRAKCVSQQPFLSRSAWPHSLALLTPILTPGRQDFEGMPSVGTGWLRPHSNPLGWEFAWGANSQGILEEVIHAQGLTSQATRLM